MGAAQLISSSSLGELIHFLSISLICSIGNPLDLTGFLEKLNNFINVQDLGPALAHSKYLINIRRQWHPTPVLLPGKSHGRRSLVAWTFVGKVMSLLFLLLFIYFLLFNMLSRLVIAFLPRIKHLLI